MRRILSKEENTKINNKLYYYFNKASEEEKRGIEEWWKKYYVWVDKYTNIKYITDESTGRIVKQALM
jgi:hypothetical protein